MYGYMLQHLGLHDILSIIIELPEEVKLPEGKAKPTYKIRRNIKSNFNVSGTIYLIPDRV